MTLAKTTRRNALYALVALALLLPTAIAVHTSTASGQGSRSEYKMITTHQLKTVWSPYGSNCYA
ncbi:MAG: hypothetical protein JWN41_1660, partial [Thermoleophilia bacterium]|nr:hypothetical protein [Thermoleophilia bacterium]